MTPKRIHSTKRSGRSTIRKNLVKAVGAGNKPSDRGGVAVKDRFDNFSDARNINGVGLWAWYLDNMGGGVNDSFFNVRTAAVGEKNPSENPAGGG